MEEASCLAREHGLGLYEVDLCALDRGTPSRATVGSSRFASADEILQSLVECETEP